MHIPDQPQTVSFPWPTTPSYEQRGCPISDATSLKKRKRDMDNWDNQINANMSTCTPSIPGDAEHIDEKLKGGYSQYLKESSSGAVTSKFGPWHSPERRTYHFRASLQTAAIKRRRLIQQQQQQSQQPHEWTAFPINISTGQKQHFYNIGSDNNTPMTAATAISKLSSLQRPKSHSHNNTGPLTPSASQTNKTTSLVSLSPCHICHRRPTTRSTLDAYGDCDLCAERTCYICLRECMSVDCNVPHFPRNEDSGNNKDNNDSNTGSNGSDWRGKTFPQNSGPVHGEEVDCERMGRKVCSWCAVEGVLEGGGEVVRCFACVAGW
ncbi:hypothetical protein AJ78_00295 [Emergomyces pasteurianus Ep9510]|uniref:Uncharacterized protein n=1 Tax=Emergomyces pasteurianus Ep9510 TaxID=1447872 RepID=A0A1J9QHX8_9EURO|nr:hypothetical protein AJ78_00295 [Emergomyces pasteurianus Ep9510]